MTKITYKKIQYFEKLLFLGPLKQNLIKNRSFVTILQKLN